MQSPRFIAPELATLVDHAPEGDGWLHEIKLDGYRMALAASRCQPAAAWIGLHVSGRWAHHLQARTKTASMNRLTAHRWWNHPPAALRYGIAILLVGAALTSSQWLQNELAGVPVWLFLCAIMLSAWFGGLLPGLLAAALGLLAFDYYFVTPIYSLTTNIWELPRFLLFALLALFVVLLSAA